MQSEVNVAHAAWAYPIVAMVIATASVRVWYSLMKAP
jgi:hypothetical protein